MKVKLPYLSTLSGASLAVWLVIWLVLMSAGSGSLRAGQQVPPTGDRALLDKYCVTCHNARTKSGGLVLDKDTIDLTRVADRADVWEKVIRKLHGRMMPPQGMPRPDEATLDAFATSLETSIDRVALAKPNPGRSPLHRLNRSEYAAAVRDVLALDIDATALLPADDEANGFDNIADVLKVSPSLLEQYLTAARKVSALAVGDPATTPVGTVYRVPPDRAQDDHIEGLPLGTRGGILVRHNFPLDATYEFNVVLLQNIVGYVPGLEWPHQLEISIDGVRVFVAPVGGEEDNKLSDTNLAQTKETLDKRLRTRVPVKAGAHAVGVTFLRKNSAESDEPLQPFTRNLDLQDMNGVPIINFMQITGPFAATGPGRHAEPPADLRLHARPASAEESPCAKKVLTTLARRAYRRPVTDAEVESLLGFYQAGRKRGTFDTGIEESLALVLASPKFLFRAEPDPPQVAAGAVYPVSDLELASRLSFFLWSTIPDDELVTVAAQGKLKDPAVLDKQVRRMLADPRSKALVDNFAAQWLFLRNLQSFIPDSDEFPNWDDNLRQAMRQETSLFFESIMREDRNVLDLLTANYTFVNERLARHYGIPNVYGSQFRPRDDRRRQPPRPARPGLGAGGDVVSEPDVAGASGQIHPRKHSRHAAAVAAGQRPAAQGNRRGRQGAVAQGADGTAPREPGVRDVPPRHGSARLLARELRRHRQVAREGSGRRRGRLGPARRRHAGGRSGGAAQGDSQAPRTVRAHDDRENADVRVGPRPRVLRHAGRPVDRARRGRPELPLLVDRHGHRQEHAVSDEEGADE